MMPFYGRFDHFQEAVLSVLAQSDPDWRLTVVDDVYPDLEPGRWVQNIDDKRISYHRNAENLRPSRNYNSCIDRADGEFMALMGCDDVMDVGYVARVAHLISRHPDAAIIQPGVRVIDGDGRPSRPLADRVKALYQPRGRGTRSLGGEPLALSLLRGNWTYFPSLVWSTAALRSRRFRTDLDVVQDLAMLMAITRDGGSLVVDDEVVFAYRRHATSVSAVTGPDGAKFAQEVTLFAEEVELCRALGWRKAARAARWHLTSRLNALTELPRSFGHGNGPGRRRLLRHIVG